MSLITLADAIQAGTTTATLATQGALARVGAHDDAVGAFVHVDEAGALAAAAAVDAQAAAGRPLGPLAGVPVTIKDLIAVAGQPLTAGSAMLAGYLPPRDATVVRKLREAGAVILGKVSLDEFAMGSTNEHAAQGPVRNPWDLGRVPGGSSGGSAAAVASGFGAASLGTDTGGSVRLPAALCGVVGVKPTYGRVSRSGVVAYASSLDQVGPLTQTVADAARVLRCIAGPCGEDATSLDPSGGADAEGWEAACGRGVDGLRVGVVSAWLDAVSDDVRLAVETAAAALEAAGATLHEVALPLAAHAVPAYYVIAMSEASANLARYDGVRFGHRAALSADDDLDALYAQSRAEGFGPEVRRRVILGTWALSSGYYDAYYDRACRVRRLVRDELTRTLQRCDVLLGPTAPRCAWPLGEALADPVATYHMDQYTTAANLAGLPAVSLPWGLGADGLPAAVQLHAAAFDEATLFRAAGALERAAPALPATPTGLTETP